MSTMNENRPIPTRRRRRFALRAGLLMAILVAGLLLFVLAARAAAGTYRVVECDPSSGAGRGELSFGGDRGYEGRARCETDGLGVSHVSRDARRGSRAGWRLEVPRGIRVSSLTAVLRGRPDGGYRPRADIRAGGHARSYTARRQSRRISWRGRAAGGLWAGLECARAGGCGEGSGALLGLRTVSLVADDDTDPRLAVSGPLLGDDSQRGIESIEAAARDIGSGVRRVSVEVNGRVVAVRVAECEKRGSVAVRLAPCPDSIDPGFPLDTREAGFHQGPNTVRVCAADFASAGRANDACAVRSVDVDNACPVSARGGGRLLEARIARHGEKRTVEGRLLGASGEPLAGRTVCVATRIELRGRVERVIAEPTTNSAGRFAAVLGRGPNRAVRVAHWSSEEQVVERRLHLSEPARPRLRVRPSRLRNGGRARFTVHVPGPSRRGVRVRIEARSDGRWLELRSGRTNASGVLRSRYRFRATTAARRYSFRAFVGPQPGYPYGAGASPVRRVAVRP